MKRKWLFWRPVAEGILSHSEASAMTFEELAETCDAMNYLNELKNKAAKAEADKAKASAKAKGGYRHK